MPAIKLHTSAQDEKQKQILDAIAGMKSQFDTILRDLDLQNKAASLMNESPIRGNSADSQPLQASLLTRIQKLEEFTRGLTDGSKQLK